MKIRTILYTALFGLGLLTASCVGDLDQMPTTETTSSEVYAQASNYRMVLAKIYASYVLAGQGQGGADGDLTTINGQDFSRGYFNLQEAATDEVANTWLSGNNLSDLTYISWSEKDSWVSDSYYWLYFNISLCNEFLRHCTESEIARFEASEQSEIRTYRAEARFMRALSYWMVLDLYRQGPKVDENTPVSGYIPEAFDGPELFDFIESDCDDCFKLYGVDLTGKTEYPEYPEGLPKELRKAPKDGPVPDPILAVGETTVNIHLLGFREGMFREISLYVNSLLNGQKSYDSEITSDGVATFKFEQYGKCFPCKNRNRVRAILDRPRRDDRRLCRFARSRQGHRPASEQRAAQTCPVVLDRDVRRAEYAFQRERDQNNRS